MDYEGLSRSDTMPPPWLSNRPANSSSSRKVRTSAAVQLESRMRSSMEMGVGPRRLVRRDRSFELGSELATEIGSDACASGGSERPRIGLRTAVTSLALVVRV